MDWHVLIYANLDWHETNLGYASFYHNCKNDPITVELWQNYVTILPSTTDEDIVNSLQNSKMYSVDVATLPEALREVEEFWWIDRESNDIDVYTFTSHYEASRHLLKQKPGTMLLYQLIDPTPEITCSINDCANNKDGNCTADHILIDEQSILCNGFRKMLHSPQLQLNDLAKKAHRLFDWEDLDSISWEDSLPENKDSTLDIEELYRNAYGHRLLDIIISLTSYWDAVCRQRLFCDKQQIMSKSITNTLLKLLALAHELGIDLSKEVSEYIGV